MENEPTGAQMLKKRPTIEANVREIMLSIPQTKGDDLLLIYYYWRKHDRIRISFRQFRDLLFSTSPESIRRSRQKLQNAKDGAGNPKYPELQPKEKTARKRHRSERAHSNYYGKGELSLTDFI